MEIRHSKLIALLILMVLGSCTAAFSQIKRLDSLKKAASVQPDTQRVKTLIKIADVYESMEGYDTALTYYLNALKLAEETGNKERIFQSLMEVSNFYEHQHKRDIALEFALNARKIAENLGDNEKLFDVLDLIGGYIYFNQQNFNQSLQYGLEMEKLAIKMNNREKIAYTKMYMGDVYRVMNKFDTAITLYSRAIESWKALRDTQMIRASLNNIGVIYDAQGRHDTALVFYLGALKIAEQEGDQYKVADYSQTVAKTYQDLKNNDKALFYANKSVGLFEKYGSKRDLADIYSLLADIYSAKADYKNAYGFLSKYTRISDSLQFGSSRANIDSLQARYKSEKTEKEIEFLKKESVLQSRLRNLFIAASVLFIIIAFLIASKYRAKKKSEELLNSKNATLTQTLDHLKSTQAQLIRSEKMASLGELTAGIAHEIQNPLNFVNNFSDLNKELIGEMNEEIKNGNYEDVLAISKNIRENEEKISHHGKRADAIVKGMLQHSRSGSGVKELTDINALADEYVRLSYHGLRAKDKSFNAKFESDFDNSIGKINIIPQEIGRVILNLINNAFYAVAEKKKTAPDDYEPAVVISTKKLNDKVEIKVSDNGNGIPQKVLDKIFQPFFTTKPTGQGTGLGLSLSYDIVTKGHGGDLKVESKEGAGASFIVTIPIT